MLKIRLLFTAALLWLDGITIFLLKLPLKLYPKLPLCSKIIVAAGRILEKKLNSFKCREQKYLLLFFTLLGADCHNNL